MTEILEPGTIARITKDHEGIEGFLYEGTIFRIDGHYDPEEVEGEWLPATYAGSGLDGLGFYEPLVEFVELYKTAADANQIKVPTAEEVAKVVSNAVMGIWNAPFSVHEGDAPSAEGMTFGATTEDGLDFEFTVNITGVSGSSW